MNLSAIEAQKQGLEQRLKDLTENYNAAIKDLSFEDSALGKLHLERRRKDISNQMEQVQGELNLLKARVAEASEQGFLAVDTGASAFDYHVMINFSPADGDWVRTRLAPELRAVGLKVLVQERQDVDVERAAEQLARKVSRVRRILPVVTPSWIESESETFCRFLSSGDDGHNWHVKVVPLRLKPCELPDEIAWLPRLDFTEVARQVESFAYLITLLGGSAKQAYQSRAESANKAFEDFNKLSKLPQLEATKSDFEETFQDAEVRISKLTRYKGLHDIFQKADDSFGQVERVKKSEEVNWEKLENAALDLKRNIDRLISFATEPKNEFPASEIHWDGKLKRAKQKLFEGIRGEEIKIVDNACEKIRQVIGQEPSVVNDRIVEQAGDMKLDNLVDVLRKSCEIWRDWAPNGDLASKFNTLESNIDALDRLKEDLSFFVDNHNYLQALDNECRLYDRKRRTFSVGDIDDMWTDLNEKASRLVGNTGSDWLLDLRATGMELGAKLQLFRTNGRAGESAESKGGTSELAKETRRLFLWYRSSIKEGCTEVDLDLLHFCEQLQHVGAGLARGLQEIDDERNE